MDEETKNYLLSQLPAKSTWVTQLEAQAEQDHVPIMEPIGMNFVMQLIRLYKPKNILEIGTAIGYSALRMTEANPNSFVTTIEIDPERYEQAQKNIRQYDKKHHIHTILGDAIVKMEEMIENKDRFDMVFIDAAKSKYKQYFNLADGLLTNNGVIITDNVLFRGYVSNENVDYKRYRTIVNKLREFNSWIVGHPSYYTSIVPIGDGVAISYKDSEENL